MAQQGITHHSAFYVIEEDQHNLHLEPRASLTTRTRTEPHLRVPHLLVSQDEDHPSLNKIVSGLFHVSNALRTPHSSCGNLETLHKTHKLDSEMAPVSSASLFPQAAVLRKSNSAVDWSTIANPSGSSKQWTLDGSEVWSTAPNSYSYSSRSGPSTREHHQSMIEASKSEDSGQSICISSPSPTQPPPSMPRERNGGHQGDHVLGGVFHRGFLSKPIVRSDEENYRYLMALDR